MHTGLPIDRRTFIATAGVALAAGGLTGSAQAARRHRLALVGTGARGSATWGQDLVQHYADRVELVGLYDSNTLRAHAARQLIGTSAPVFASFDTMVRTSRPDAVVVASVDATHAAYIVRSLELGCDVLTEKPMCTDAEQCQSILDAQRRTGRNVTVTLNARHAREARRLKALLLEGAIGEVTSVDFHEYLDTSHGADYFRRWHRLRQHSGTLLVHKASHHFDLANWWLGSDPVEVSAAGDLRFYGRNNPYRGPYCRACPHAATCPFYWDITRNPRHVALYVNCEQEDGYRRDGCVWDETTDSYDTMSVRVRYASGATLTYTAATYLPREGMSVSLNGTRGRLDYADWTGGGQTRRELRLTRMFRESELVTDLPPERAGGHGGADASLQDLLFRNEPADDPLALRAGLRAGALSSLVGIAARTSIDRGGAVVRIADLVRM